MSNARGAHPTGRRGLISVLQATAGLRCRSKSNILDPPCLSTIVSPDQGPAANRRYAIEFMSHWFYNIIGFGGRALPAPVAELRWRHRRPRLRLRANQSGGLTLTEL